MSFTFKQFTIHQQHCAQKVSEVACLQGAWTSLPAACKKVLDIGSGTGLLSLMIAQRYNVEIDAIEIEENCFQQGKENIEASPFREKIRCFYDDVKNLQSASGYDFIITNPPFFERQLMSDKEHANTAKHSTKLSLNELISIIKELLVHDGQFSILFPYERKIELENCCATHTFYPLQTLLIKHSGLHQPKVFISVYSREKTIPSEQEFIIKQYGTYTSEMKALMEEYYL